MRTSINTTTNNVRCSFIAGRTIVGGMGDVVRNDHALYLRLHLPAAALAAKAACAKAASKCRFAQGGCRQSVQPMAVSPSVVGRLWRERREGVAALSRLS